ncbi:MAG: DNA repair protein RecN [Chlamydiales bacterium]|nr:DNA repair protein RecN [Chlamydiales bacterium]
MLLRLFIKNLVLVETCEIQLQPGFSVITGETGAGKSIILSSLSLLLGQRQESSLIRQGASSSIVEATFAIPKLLPLLDEAGISYEEDGEIIIRRELLASGKSRAFINDQTVQLAFLKKIAPHLIEVSAQHAHIELRAQNAPMDMLDSFADNAESLQAFQSAHKEAQGLKKAKIDFREHQQSLNRKIQTATREIEEIDSINPVDGEDDELFLRFSDLAKITESMDQVAELLATLDDPEHSILASLARSKTLLERLAAKNEHFLPYAESFKSAYSDLQDLAFELSKAQDASGDAQVQFAEIDDRLKKLHELKKKYGPTLSDVLAWREKQNLALKEYQAIDVSEEELDEKLAVATKHATALSSVVTKRRQDASVIFSKSVTEQLHQLNMPSALFEVVLEPQERNSHGDEAVHFYLTPNRGEPRVLLQESASGGELARVSLAIKCVMMGKNPVGTILFDEIDANIGGETATVVGKKLSELGKSCQVIVVSHFAQVAVRADHHFCIQKTESEERTTTRIHPLETETERHQELNRMLGGNASLLVQA